MNDIWGLIWLGVLLLINAFFVGAEFAVISARRSQIEPLAENGSGRAKTALWAMENATLMLATCQLGVTIASLLILNVSEPALHNILENTGIFSLFSHDVIRVITFSITLLLVTYLHVVLGEMVPKNAAFSMPGSAILLLAPPLVFVSKLCIPVIWLLNSVANGILKILGITPQTEANSAFTLDEVESIVNHSTKEGTLEDRAGTLSAAFEFTAKKVGDLVVPVENLTILPLETTPLDIETAVARHGFSRYLLDDGAGGVRGYVHVKDMLNIGNAWLSHPISSKRVRQLENFTADTDVEDALARMQKSGTHLARIFQDEAFVGVVFLEDILEELVGEVRDATQRRRFA